MKTLKSIRLGLALLIAMFTCVSARADAFATATGASEEKTVGAELVRIFTNHAATATLTVARPVYADILAVGGGGSGGGNMGAGGGGGGVVLTNGVLLTAGTYEITVGAGGAKGNWVAGNNGGASSVVRVDGDVRTPVVTALGGGGGGNYNTAGGTGATGGGNRGYGTRGLGCGGAGYPHQADAAGGGSVLEIGQEASGGYGGAGGRGFYCDISGENDFYGWGGGGSSKSTAGCGGAGDPLGFGHGGGSGTAPDGCTGGRPGHGGGGGGMRNANTLTGGSGTVIIRYALLNEAAAGAPIVRTAAQPRISSTSLRLAGVLDGLGASASVTVRLLYGTSAERLDASVDVGALTATGDFVGTISGLEPYTDYYYCFEATGASTARSDVRRAKTLGITEMSYTGLASVTTNGTYEIVAFTNGVATVTFTKAGTVDLLVVGGGGSGANRDSSSHAGGGGGGGGVLTKSEFAVETNRTYAITVGAGGAVPEQKWGLAGLKGGDSFIALGGEDVMRAYGGGGGNDYTALGGVASLGASGGGVSGNAIVKTSIPGYVCMQGCAGAGAYAAGAGTERNGGGGGGAGGDGEADDDDKGGNGGAGIASDIFGDVRWFGAGGGGAGMAYGTYPGGDGLGGSGVGGDANKPGAANTGSGGGGCNLNLGAEPARGAGADGIVVIRRRIADSEGQNNLFVRTLDEESFGTVTPDYGSHAIAPGAAVSVVASTVVRADNVRSRPTGYTVETLQSDGSWSDPVSHAGTTCAFTMDSGVYRVTFEWTREARLSVDATSGGTVSASAAPVDAGWYPLGAAVTLTAVPDAGHAFTVWGGDVAYAQTTDNPITLSMDVAKSVTAAFQTAPAGGQTFTWCGADGANWFDTANWQNGDGAGGLPIAGDTAAIPVQSGRIVIDRSTHNLKTLVVPNGVTLVATNWTTCIRAASVTVASGGAITCAGPFADRTDDVVAEIQMSNRVWIAATDLTVEKGGKIDVSNLGYGSLVKTQNQLTRCYGPGCGTALGTSASHGGIGGGTADPNMAYGSAREPTAPGSSGFKIANQYYNEYAACGGGAVRLDLTGTLTLAGAISANGEGGSYRCHSSGSGGSVLVTARNIVASSGASITALGGNGAKNFSSAGGGGRIALHVDSAAQTAEDVANLAISAAAGERSASETAQPGTVWVSDAKLLAGLNGGLVEGEIFVGDATELAFDSLVITNAFVRFGGSVKRVTVSGDLTLAGAAPRLSFGADRFERQYPSMVRDFYTDEATPFELVVGGDFNVGTGAAVDFYAAQTNGTGVAVGGAVAVAGRWLVASDAVVRSWCHRGTGAAFAFSANDLTIETNAVFTASAAGFAGSGKVSPSVPGYGPGRGYATNETTGNIGAGYGGLGARATAGGAYGQTYGDAARPSLAGSGGSGQYWDGPGGAGGGYLHFTVSRRMTLAGTVSADGECVGTGSPGGYYRQSMGSGGGILIDARKFAMNPGAVLSAKGANGGLDNKKVPLAGGAGGGGRIAIWTGQPWDASCAAKDLSQFEVPVSALVPSGATVTAAGGTTGDDTVFGGEGTVRCYCRSAGLMLIVR